MREIEVSEDQKGPCPLCVSYIGLSFPLHAVFIVLDVFPYPYRMSPLWCDGFRFQYWLLPTKRCSPRNARQWMLICSKEWEERENKCSLVPYGAECASRWRQNLEGVHCRLNTFLLVLALKAWTNCAFWMSRELWRWASFSGGFVSSSLDWLVLDCRFLALIHRNGYTLFSSQIFPLECPAPEDQDIDIGALQPNAFLFNWFVNLKNNHFVSMRMFDFGKCEGKNFFFLFCFSQFQPSICVLLLIASRKTFIL